MRFDESVKIASAIRLDESVTIANPMRFDESVTIANAVRTYVRMGVHAGIHTDGPGAAKILAKNAGQVWCQAKFSVGPKKKTWNFDFAQNRTFRNFELLKLSGPLGTTP